jgi:hypothetical protein
MVAVTLSRRAVAAVDPMADRAAAARRRTRAVRDTDAKTTASGERFLGELAANTFC